MTFRPPHQPRRFLNIDESLYSFLKKLFNSDGTRFLEVHSFFSACSHLK